MEGTNASATVTVGSECCMQPLLLRTYSRRQAMKRNCDALGALYKSALHSVRVWRLELEAPRASADVLWTRDAPQEHRGARTSAMPHEWLPGVVVHSCIACVRVFNCCAPAFLH